MELFRWAKTCRDARSAVQSYCGRAFNISKLLGRFFTPREIYYFRYWQSRTGTLISGSTALQFFDRSVYPGSDLDIYVEHRYCLPVANWLLSIGYSFEPREDQSSTFDKALEETPDEPQFSDFFPSQQIGYFGRGLANIFNFHKRRPDRKIQLISALYSPVEIVLNFHSTCVMNVITHEKAYSLYPLATFEQRRSLICATEGSKQDVARAKYVSRGWTMEESLSASEVTDLRSDFVRGDRAIGDKACWTITLTPSVSHFSMDHITTNTWALEYSKDFKAETTFMLLNTPVLQYAYTISNDDIKEYIQAVIAYSNGKHSRYDKDVNMLLMSYRDEGCRSSFP